ncbi:hypothetical protein BLOT_006852 [Blomia tropicalis]|nr:hypothetical protein BLOT_006852 [Blomia tropicalis]
MIIDLITKFFRFISTTIIETRVLCDDDELSVCGLITKNSAQLKAKPVNLVTIQTGRTRERRVNSYPITSSLARTH